MTIRGKIREIIKELSELDNFISSHSSSKSHIEGYELGTYIDDIDIEIAKGNYEKFKEKTKLKREDYIKTLYYLINRDSANGKLFVDTPNICNEDFITYEFLVELGDYFKEKGFKCELFGNSNSGYLRISGWQ